MKSDLPTGTVTFLFTDVEGSTRLLDELGATAYGALLAEHHRLCREAWAAHDGVEVGTSGDAFFVAFARPSDALAAAAAAQEALAPVGVSVRMGVHTGEVTVTETGYVGLDVHRAARIAASGHGGQVLVSAATATLVAMPLTDLGEHRFKDLRAPERVFQLGDAKFPRLKSLHRSNLPTPATPFLGREAELGAVVAMLVEPGARLVSLTGPGGTGKTRLALQAAAEASDRFPDGVFWAPLAPLRDPGLMLAEVAAAVGVRESGDSALDALGGGLAGKRLLVFLDNMEHLLPAAADHLAALVAACPTITVVVTSRERLQIPGERVFAVPPMSEADGEALFRRRAADTGIELEHSTELRELCARLDNLPLALELAAARMVLFSPTQLLDRLGQRLDLLKGGRGADARQETLRATIAWSYDVLTPGEQRLFRRLSVFVGGCTYDSAAHVADADPDTLQSLLDKSLLRRSDSPAGPRFWMLETIRQYGAQELEAVGETGDIRCLHLDHYASVAEECGDDTGAANYDLERLEAERDNLRLALDLAIETDPEIALALAVQLTRDWMVRGEAREGQEKLEATLALAPQRPTPARLAALLGASRFARDQRDLRAADEFAREGLNLSRALGDRAWEGQSLLNLGWNAFCRRDLHEARRSFDDAADALDSPGAEPFLLQALEGIGIVLSSQGDHSGAVARQREVVARARRVVSESELMIYLNNLGNLELAAGELGPARRSLEESVSLARRSRNKPFLSGSLQTLARILQTSAPADALAAVSTSLQLADEMHSQPRIAGCLEAAAGIFAIPNPAHAASLLGAASAIRAGTGSHTHEKAGADATEARCREALTAEAFRDAWEQGAALDAEAAADWAFEVWEHLGQTLR